MKNIRRGEGPGKEKERDVRERISQVLIRWATVQIESLEAAAARCAKELGGIDYVM
jgi:hypothetical protein